MAAYIQRFKVSAKDATSVTLVPAVDGDASLRETGRVISQIVLTSTGLADHTTERFFSEVNRVVKLSIERE